MGSITAPKENINVGYNMTSITINIDMRRAVLFGVIHDILANSNMYPMNIESVIRSVTSTCGVVNVCFVRCNAFLIFV